MGINFESWERYNQRKLHNTMAAAADYVQIRYRGKKHTLERQRGAKQTRRDRGDPPGPGDYTVDRWPSQARFFADLPTAHMPAARLLPVWHVSPTIERRLRVHQASGGFEKSLPVNVGADGTPQT